MRSRSLVGLYWLVMAVGGAFGGMLVAWAAAPAPPGRVVVLFFVAGLLVALVSHVLLWRGQAFRLGRTLTPIIFFTWWGSVAEVFSYWLSRR